jgi:hypothetical protein
MGKQARHKRVRAGDALLLYAKVAPDVLYTHFSPDCCLNGTRVFLDVMQAFNIEAQAVATHVIVANPPMWRLMRTTGSMPRSEEEAASWAAEGAWSIEVSGELGARDEYGWPWHLVAVAGDVIVDSSARQFNRPARKILTPDVLVMRNVSPDFVTGGAVAYKLPTGTIASYRGRPDVRFDDLPGFQRTSGNIAVAAEIIERIRKRL